MGDEFEAVFDAQTVLAMAKQAVTEGKPVRATIAFGTTPATVRLFHGDDNVHYPVAATADLTLVTGG